MLNSNPRNGKVKGVTRNLFHNNKTNICDDDSVFYEKKNGWSNLIHILIK